MEKQEETIFWDSWVNRETSKGSRPGCEWKKTDKEEGGGNTSEEMWHTVKTWIWKGQSSCGLWNKTFQTTYLALGTQRMYMQPIRFPRLDRVRNTSVVSSSLCEYWNSARSIRWSFHLPSKGPAPPLPATDAMLRARRLDVPVAPGAAGTASGSGRKAYVGSGGRKASLAAMRLGQGGQQNRQQSSPKERPFILHCAGGRQEDHCANESTSSQCLHNEILITM